MLRNFLFDVEPAVSLVDRPQQFVEPGRILDWPRAIERRTQQVQITPGKQTDGHDALAHDTLRNLIYIRNVSKPLLCLTFHLRIVRAA
jgi:hypothetical protein